jgi:hypothetical protein
MSKRTQRKKDGRKLTMTAMQDSISQTTTTFLLQLITQKG